MLIRLLVITLIVGFFSSCDSGSDQSQTQIPDNEEGNLVFVLEDGTAEMTAMLRSLVEEGNPQDHYHWNTQLAAFLKDKMEDPTDPKRNRYWYDYCYQVLNSGNTQACILEIEKFRVARDIEYEEMCNPQGKRILELLGLAYLRLGEQQNCHEHHTPSSCILPLDTEAQHLQQRGSKKAIQIFTMLNEAFPNDKYKWLLNLAHMTLGQHPHGVGEQHLIEYPNWDLETSNFPPFLERASQLGVAVNQLCGGVCMDDFNNDGNLDIFATSYGMQDQVRLFLNNGEGGYDDMTASSGLTGIVSGLNCLHADYDNDGDTDILVLRGGWLRKGGNHPNSLLRNNGDGTFSDVTKAAGILSFHPTQTAAWADVNRDGWLDLFIGNETTGELKHACELYINRGDGRFIEAATEHGLGNLKVFAKGTAFGDINNDGWPDLFISVLGGKNKLYLNEKGILRDISSESGIQEPIYSFPCWFWDVNHDGFDDIFVSGYDTRDLDNLAAEYAKEIQGKNVETDLPRLYMNNGDLTFTERSEQYGVDRTMYAMGANFGDLDNNGYLDFYVGTGAPDFATVVPNRMFRNKEGLGFEEVTAAGRFGHIQKGHGIGFADLDRDGDQDIYAVMGGALEGDVYPNVLFENPIEINNWVVLQLEGTLTNRSAIGTRVVVKTNDGKTFYHRVGTGGSFGASSLQLEIGLGPAEMIDQIEVQWQNGETEIFQIVIPNKKYHLKEGSGELEELEYAEWDFNLTADHQHQH